MKNFAKANENDVTEVKLPKPEIDLKFEHIKQFSFIHGQLPLNFVDEANQYFDINNMM